MANKEFDEFLKRQASHSQSKKIDWAAKRSEWIEYLDRFYKTIESYLKSYVDEGKIKISYYKKEIFEQYIGEYEAQTATISLGANRLKLDPIGTNLIGSKGRVDLIGPNGKIKFVLVDSAASAPKISARVYIKGEKPPSKEKLPEVTSWAWKIATQPPHIKYYPLVEESFYDALMEVSNG
ncbi:MAG: hypothetical protein P9X24_12630 [Candidatus Hatepunaea meridiana]|nr:hypothetical protein [Candidatus Hatepunaea meridiana]